MDGNSGQETFENLDIHLACVHWAPQLVSPQYSSRDCPFFPEIPNYWSIGNWKLPEIQTRIVIQLEPLRGTYRGPEGHGIV